MTRRAGRCPTLRVRLAVGGESGGKAVYSTTDKSGAFTLRGLRPGSSYTVIAEYQGKSGMMTGRVDAQAPDANVRIGLRRRDAGLDDVPDLRPPGPSQRRADLERPGIRRGRRDEDEEARPAPRANREDLDPVAAGGRGGGPEGAGQLAARSRSRRSRPSRPGAMGAEPARHAGDSEGSTRAGGVSVLGTAGGGSGRVVPVAGKGRRGRRREPASAGTRAGQRRGRPGSRAVGRSTGRPRQESERRSVVAIATRRSRSSRAIEADPADLDSPEEEASPRPLPQGLGGVPVSQSRGLRPDHDGAIPTRRRGGPVSRAPAEDARRKPRGRGLPGSTPAAKPRPTWGELSFQKPRHPAGRDAPEGVARHPGRHRHGIARAIGQPAGRDGDRLRVRRGRAAASTTSGSPT